MSTQPTYAAALEELEKLSDEIESGHADPDTLLQKIKRSQELIQYCRKRLREAEEEIKKAKDDF